MKIEANDAVLYMKALEKWGLSMQAIILIEEMAELQKELCKALRWDPDKDKLAEEIADVEIMLEQLVLGSNIPLNSIKCFRDQKLERLRHLLTSAS